MSDDRYKSSDQLFKIIDDNVATEQSLDKLLDIDHSRLAAEVEAHMPPAKVLIFGNIELEAELLRKNRLAGIDLPLRILAYESTPNGPSKLI